MAIRRVARTPRIKKERRSINANGVLITPSSIASPTQAEKKDRRVYLASSSEKVPFTELKYNELSQEERKEYNILFNNEVNPVAFINVFQNAVANNLYQTSAAPKQKIQEEIDGFIADTAEALVIALQQQQTLFTPLQIEENQINVDQVVSNIVMAQEAIAAAVEAEEQSRPSTTTPTTRYTPPKPTPEKTQTEELKSVIKETEQKKSEELKASGKAVTISIKELSKTVSGAQADADLRKAGFKRVDESTYINPETGDSVTFVP